MCPPPAVRRWLRPPAVRGLKHKSIMPAPKRSVLVRRKNIQKALEAKKKLLRDGPGRSSSPDHSAPDHPAPDHSAPDHPAPDHSAPDHSAQASLSEDGSGREQRPPVSCGRRILSMDDVLNGIDALCAHSQACHPPHKVIGGQLMTLLGRKLVLPRHWLLSKLPFKTALCNVTSPT